MAAVTCLGADHGRSDDHQLSSMRMQRHLAPTAVPVSVATSGVRSSDCFRRSDIACGWKQSSSGISVSVTCFLLLSWKAALATIVEAFAKTSSQRKVIIPAYTCVSVPSAIVRAGGQVVL